MEEEMKSGYEGLEKSWMAAENSEVIDHWPPAYIIGQESADPVLIDTYEDDNVCVKLLEIPTEYMYSNPTGMFNLSLPNVAMRTSHFSTMKYADYKDMLRRREIDRLREEHEEVLEKRREEIREAQQKGEEVETEPEAEFEYPPEEPLDVRKWADFKQEASTLLRVEVQNKQ